MVPYVEIKFEQVPMIPVKFERILQELKIKLRSIAITLINKIRERFHKDDLIEAMAIVNPNFWNPISDYNNIIQFFNEYMKNIVTHLGKIVEVNSVDMKGILDKKDLIQLSIIFSLKNGWLV